jgi:ribonuclease HII
LHPLYAFDASWVESRQGPLAGADEAGRGALAGPIAAAAVVLGEEEIERLADSKAVTITRRGELYRGVMSFARAISVALLPEWWIDRHGMGEANREVLRRVLSELSAYCGCCLADGNLNLSPEIESLPRADTASAAVAASGVVAKVLRDAVMKELSATHSAYGFERNRGYGTPEHRAALWEHGPCRVHRLSWLRG